MNRITLRREASTRFSMNAHYPLLESTVSPLSSLIVCFRPLFLAFIDLHADRLFTIARCSVCVFQVDRKAKKLVLTELAAGVTEEDVRKATGAKYETSPNLKVSFRIFTYAFPLSSLLTIRLSYSKCSNKLFSMIEGEVELASF